MKNQWPTQLINGWRVYRATGIRKPVLMTEATWQSVLDQHEQLSAAGWDGVAIKGYYRYLHTQLEGLADDLFMQDRIKSCLHSCDLIGSSAYTHLYQASQLGSRARLELVLKHLGAVLDDFNFLQLTSNQYRIDPQLPPTGLFWQLFRHDVQQTFTNNTLAQYTDNNVISDSKLHLLATQIHCFRSYIDLQCLTYIRVYQHGRTDYEKLRDFANQHQIELDYQTGANYHNRYQGQFTYPKNMKVQLPKKEKMVEFIVELDTGNFVSEWNVYRYQANDQVDSNPAHYDNDDFEQIANTESFNYGRPQHSSHRKLDIEHPTDPDLRRFATREWRYEPDFDDDGEYADIVNRGGIADYEAWLLMPVNSRQVAYADYVAECRQLNLRREYGFERFYLGTNE